MLCHRCKKERSNSEFSEGQLHDRWPTCRPCIVKQNQTPEAKARRAILKKKHDEAGKSKRKPIDGKLKCSRCLLAKEVPEFGHSKTFGFQRYCKPCGREAAKEWSKAHPGYHAQNAREWAKRNPELAKVRARKAQLKKYLLSQEDYDAMRVKQGGGCKICGATEPGYGKKHLVVDHDHRCCPGEKTCGKCVRGLLCYSCNTGVGDFRDNIGFLIRAAEYVKTGGNLPPIVH